MYMFPGHQRSPLCDHSRIRFMLGFRRFHFLCHHSWRIFEPETHGNIQTEFAREQACTSYSSTQPHDVLHSGKEHKARANPALASIFQRTSLSTSWQGASRLSGSCLSKVPGSCFRSWLLLASTRRLPLYDKPEDQRGVLATEIHEQHGS